jgi:hypothetical protein
MASAVGRSTSSAHGAATRYPLEPRGRQESSAWTSAPHAELAAPSQAVGAPPAGSGRRPRHARARRTADLLYTGRGSLVWLQDLDAWAAVLHRLLAPDGRLVLFEGHPIEWLFDIDEDGGWIATDYDYFAGSEASKGWAPEYIDHLSVDEADQHWKFARSWTLGEIITALLGAGLRLERVTEHPTDWWGGHGDVREDERGRIPLSFSVVARRGSA